jgi:hypothetical protein
METEILSDEELADLTGYKARGLGITLGVLPVTPPPLPTMAWTPDFSRVK